MEFNQNFILSHEYPHRDVCATCIRIIDDTDGDAAARLLLAVTRCRSASLTICSGVFRRYKMRLLTGIRCHEHITPVSRQLHWLPVRQRIEFMLAAAVYGVQSNEWCVSIISGGRLPAYLYCRPTATTRECKPGRYFSNPGLRV